MSEEFSRPPRTIIVCFDGTAGQYCSTNTNVVKFFGLLRKDCPDQQAIYYQPGIGTYYAPGIVSPILTGMASLLDQAIAWYLDAHVMSGYKFLMDNYLAGDKICIFGFSRGAYTARALGGMLDKIGLMTKGNLQQISFAYKLFTRTDNEGIKLAAGFKKTFSQTVKIDFVGVWDTVQSTGVLFSRTLPFTSSNTAIRVFRHALSLDERRARFRPNLYHWPTPEPDDTQNESPQKSGGILSFFTGLFTRQSNKNQPSSTAEPGASANGAEHNGNGDEATGSQTQNMFVTEEEESSTDVLEVWFAGNHSDVGGGNVPDDVDVSLAQIPLHWMVEQVMEAQCGIVFDENELAGIGFGKLPVPNGSAPTLGSFPEHPGALARLFDQLKIDPLWWILEFLPVANAWQDSKGAWHRQWRINMGRGRFIPYQKPKFYHTVKERMDSQTLKYKPNAVYDYRDEIYV